MKRSCVLFACMLTLVFTACESKEPPHLPSKNYRFVDTVPETLGYREVVYVPVYSEIYRSEGVPIQLTATLSIRNTSMETEMYVSTVNYYDSSGKHQKRYIERSILINPLESVEFFVPYSETKGGVGANFIVEWGAQEENIDPIIETIMIGDVSQIGISFIGKSKVIKSVRSQKKED
jgi:hypothetical protein